MKSLPIHIKILLWAISAMVVFSFIGKTYDLFVGIYNSTKELSLSYDKTVQEQVSNYDGYYLAFTDKQQNANINKETFVQVTNIIMSNRKDGQSVAWKWTQENQQIPYSEFTIFYKELSSFITERYQDNMQIERTKQFIVQKHNLLIDRFPNNIINRFLHIKHLEYKVGYLSEETKAKFNK